MAAAKTPAYQQRFTISRNFSATYFTRAIVVPTIARALGESNPELPRTLKWRQFQLGHAIATATQMNRRALELENFVKQRLKPGYR
jgi:hypothetical protein